MTETVLICGATGQLGLEVQLTCPKGVRVIACDRRMLDITNLKSIEHVLDESGARKIINAAAYTSVDQSEADADTARLTNAIGPANLAQICKKRGLRLLHVSTDFVFDGKQSYPYQPNDLPNPLGVYGQTKLEGELAVADSNADAVIVRTSWVYSRHGNNFVKTMLRLIAERDRLTVVENQVGTPTWARGLANVCWSLLFNPSAQGTYHWSDTGVCSWYDFAVEIRQLGLNIGLLNKAAEVLPIPASDYPTQAARPVFSVLDKTTTRSLLGCSGIHWRKQLQAMLKDLHRDPCTKTISLPGEA